MWKGDDSTEDDLIKTEDELFQKLVIAKSHNRKLLLEIGFLKSEIDELKYNLQKALNSYSTERQKLLAIENSESILCLQKELSSEKQKHKSYKDLSKKLKKDIKKQNEVISSLVTRLNQKPK